MPVLIIIQFDITSLDIKIQKAPVCLSVAVIIRDYLNNSSATAFVLYVFIFI